ncbi:MAG TPA: ATP-binding protein [Armatimonadota bacterium]|jgi:signal transduction histidine kinase
MDATPPPVKILVVDDEIGIRQGCRRVLTAEGFEVLLAETAEEGLTLLGSHPDVMLSLVDLKMPGMGGLEFLPRAVEIAPEMASVVITAYATIETAVEATKRGAYDFMVKPFTPDDLLRLTRKALQHVALVQERNRLQADQERRLLELATEQSRLGIIISAMAEGVLVANAEGKLVLHNPAALRVLPRCNPAAEVCDLHAVIEPPALLDLMTEAGAQRKRLTREINLTHLPDPTWVLADTAPVVEAGSGVFLGTVTLMRDITELKKVEQVKAQFVNMVAHELRAPLAAIDGYLALMQEGIVSDPAKQKEMVDRSRQRLKALLDLVSDLLNVARMEAGTVQREIVPRNLAEIVAEVVEIMTPLAAERNLTFEVDVPATLPPVEADREELIRLFNNLVSNAIKYNREDGKMRITGESDGAYVKLAVSDTGIGISEEGVKRLFSEFFREKRSENRYVTGTGLGLSIVKRILDYYHGRVQVTSRLGEGTTFHLWLPCKFQRVEGEAPVNGPTPLPPP